MEKMNKNSTGLIKHQIFSTGHLDWCFRGNYRSRHFHRPCRQDGWFSTTLLLPFSNFWIISGYVGVFSSIFPHLLTLNVHWRFNLVYDDTATMFIFKMFIGTVLAKNCSWFDGDAREWRPILRYFFLNSFRKDLKISKSNHYYCPTCNGGKKGWTSLQPLHSFTSLHYFINLH